MQRPERDLQPVDSSTEGLPRAFLQSLRTLFDILDDRRRGSVHISEIESRWQQGTDTAEQLPQGVLDGLRKVAPASGYLTFERFVAGLRCSLQLHPAAERHRDRAASLSAPPLGGRKENAWGKPRPSVPQASDPNRAKKQQQPAVYGTVDGELKGKKPSPLGVRLMNGGAENPHMGVERVPGPQEPGSRRTEPSRAGQRKNSVVRGPVDILILEGSNARGGEGKTMGRSQSESTYTAMADSHQQSRGRGELRRHTLTNGVDYGMLKRMKELEQEKDFLLHGLELVEWSRDWYLQQIQAVQDQQKHVGKNTANKDSFLEGNPSRLTGLLPKLQEVNRCLSDLVSATGKPLKSSPTAPNGIVHSTTASATSALPPGSQQQAVNMLKEQNRLLTKEVTDKSERITQLEQEKSALIKQLFEARARNTHDNSQLDSTFI